jgi:hypothetical protein
MLVSVVKAADNTGYVLIGNEQRETTTRYEMADIMATQLQGLGEFSGSRAVVTDDSRERPAYYLTTFVHGVNVSVVR